MRQFFFLAVYILIGGSLGAQPADITWLEDATVDKSQRTLAISHAGPDGFVLLCVSEGLRDAAGKAVPALPVVVRMSKDGNLMHNTVLPDFSAGGERMFRFFVPGDYRFLAVYESALPEGGFGLFARSFDARAMAWAGEAVLLFKDVRAQRPAFERAWYRQSADGTRSCVYNLHKPTLDNAVDLAVLDKEFAVKWQKTVFLPAQTGAIDFQQAYCSNAGEILLHGRFYGTERARMLSSVVPPAVFRTDGRAVFDPARGAGINKAFADVLFLVPGQTGEIGVFFPKLGKKFTSSFEISEDRNGRLLCAGFASDASDLFAENYFIYQVDPKNASADILRNERLPGSLRKFFGVDKSDKGKEMVEGLALRRFEWTPEGQLWLFAEREFMNTPRFQLDEVVVMRLDSTAKITTVKKLEKFQRTTDPAELHYLSSAALRLPKDKWWILWSRVSEPANQLMLSDLKNAEAEDFPLGSPVRAGVNMLPHTLVAAQGKWYFAAESKNRKRLRIGVIAPAAGSK